MDRKEALQTLSLEEGFDAEALDDALDEQLFVIKKNVLAKYLAPTLLGKQLRIVSALRDAYSLLVQAAALPLSNAAYTSPFIDIDALIPFLETYEQQLSAAKLATQSACNTEQLHQGIVRLQQLQEAYMHHFLLLWPGDNSISNVSSREALDTGVALRLLRAQSGEVEAMLHKEAARIRALMGQ